ncbi:hypothetical protein DFH11DRAFT_1626783 [Phellopilus nigrolimitatus]|nr:hypothetical protein DFH11DRAFT_1626783 [Phellopilus nigrolimitatus]
MTFPASFLFTLFLLTNSSCYHLFKWHPKDPDTLAMASDSNIYLLNVADTANILRDTPFTHRTICVV